MYLEVSTVEKFEVWVLSLSVPKAPFSVLQALVEFQVLSGLAGSTCAPLQPLRTWPGGWLPSSSRSWSRALPRAWSASVSKSLVFVELLYIRQDTTATSLAGLAGVAVRASSSWEWKQRTPAAIPFSKLKLFIHFHFNK